MVTKEKKINKKILFLLFIIIYLLIINNHFVEEKYRDNKNYFNGYSLQSEIKISEIKTGFLLHIKEVGAFEPVYFIVTFIISKFLSYEYFIFVLNLVLGKEKLSSSWDIPRVEPSDSRIYSAVSFKYSRIVNSISSGALNWSKYPK